MVIDIVASVSLGLGLLGLLRQPAMPCGFDHSYGDGAGDGYEAATITCISPEERDCPLFLGCRNERGLPEAGIRFLMPALVWCRSKLLSALRTGVTGFLWRASLD
jgi:hypothetical protein